MVVVAGCALLSMKYETQNIIGRPGVSMMSLGGLACGPMTCYPSEAAL